MSNEMTKSDEYSLTQLIDLLQHAKQRTTKLGTHFINKDHINTPTSIPDLIKSLEPYAEIENHIQSAIDKLNAFIQS